MSVCISQHGEFGSHEPDDVHTCKLCGALDEEGLFAELRKLRAELAKAREAYDLAHADRPGAPIDEWDQAATAALREWEELNPGKTAYDDWATVHTDDEHVIIRITILEVERRG